MFVLSRDRKIVDGLMFAVFLTLCFNNVHALGKLPTVKVMATFARDLYWFPLLGAVVYTGWCALRRRIQLVGLSRFGAYYLALLAVGAVAIWLNRGTITVESSRLGFEFWQFKTLALDAFWCVSAVYVVTVWYRSCWRRLVKLASVAIGCALVPAFVVALIDVVGQAGVNRARQLSYAMARVANGLSPDIGDLSADSLRLYYGRIRSIFPEPSFLGIWAAGALPIILFRLKDGRLWRAFACAIITLMVVSMSRMAILSLLVILAAYVVLVVAWPRKWTLLRPFGVVVGAAVLLSCAMIYSYKDRCAADITAGDGQMDVAEFSTGGSTFTRLKSNEVELRVFRAHPWFGCGYTLCGFVFGDYITPAERKQFAELDYWLSHQEKVGRSAYRMTPLSTITSVFAESGLVGALLVFLPLLAVFGQLIRKCWRTHSADAGLMAVLALGIATTFFSCHVFPLLWTSLALGLSLAYLHGEGDKCD